MKGESYTINKLNFSWYWLTSRFAINALDQVHGVRMHRDLEFIKHFDKLRYTIIYQQIKIYKLAERRDFML